MQVDLGLTKFAVTSMPLNAKYFALIQKNDRGQEIVLLKCTLSKQKFQKWEEKASQIQSTNEASKNRP